MTAAKLCAAYAVVARKHALPPMALAALHVETHDFSDPEAAWEALRDRKPAEGWLQFQSHIAVFRSGSLPKPDPDWGCLLAAETLDAKGHSIHVRQAESGGLRLTIATPLAAAADTENVFLTDDVRHLATDKAPGLLCHRRYWRVEPAMGVAPVFAAFQGFARRKDT